MKRKAGGFVVRQREKSQVFRRFPEDNTMLESLVLQFNAKNSALGGERVSRQDFLRDLVGPSPGVPELDIPQVRRADEEASLVRAVPPMTACDEGFGCEGYKHFRLVPCAFRHGKCVLCLRNRVLRAFLYSQISGKSYISSFYLTDYANIIGDGEYTNKFCLKPGREKWQGLGAPYVIHQISMYRRESDRIVQLYPRSE